MNLFLILAFLLSIGSALGRMLELSFWRFLLRQSAFPASLPQAGACGGSQA